MFRLFKVHNIHKNPSCVKYASSSDQCVLVAGAVLARLDLLTQICIYVVLYVQQIGIHERAKFSSMYKAVRTSHQHVLPKHSIFEFLFYYKLNAMFLITSRMQSGWSAKFWYQNQHRRNTAISVCAQHSSVQGAFHTKPHWILFPLRMNEKC